MTTEPPERSRSVLRIPYARFWNIALRTAHIAVSGTLVGGHVFGQSRQALWPWLVATIGTGLALLFVESFSAWRWFHQGRGLMVMAKLLLLASIPWFWDSRVAILMVVVVLASVGSHMPGRFRYYSVLHRRVLD